MLQRHRSLAIVLTALLVSLGAFLPRILAAQPTCSFRLGFRDVRDQIPGIVGECLEDEHFNLQNGNSEQRTSGGLLVWRKADNWTAFTNGSITWINGPTGLVSRPNSGPLFPWEAAASPFGEEAAPAETIQYPHARWAWDKIPTVVISASEGDQRIRLAGEAVRFWNGQLEELGTPFRLGQIVRTDVLVPTDFLAQRSEAVLDEAASAGPVPDVVRGMPGDLIIALTDGNFVSFTNRFGASLHVLIGIRSDQTTPLNLPNVARNVIAHELGHAVGLGHNNDATKLMCGRPAPCRPDKFVSDTDAFFPLTDAEKSYLQEIYPPTWRPTR